jgi:hypothetical protein
VCQKIVTIEAMNTFVMCNKLVEEALVRCQTVLFAML